MRYPSRHKERGSAILYVFIGVILFAALMFTFTRSASNTNQKISLSQANLTASEIVAYGSSVDKGVNKLLLSGCSEIDLRFYHPDFSITPTDYAGQAGYKNPPNNKCHVFDPETGKVPFKKPPKVLYNDYKIADYAFIGGLGVIDIGKNGCDDTELSMLIEVPLDVCLQYNTINGVTNPNGAPPLDQYGNFFRDTPGWIVTDLKRDANNAAKFGWPGGGPQPVFGCGTTIGNNPAFNSAIYLKGKENGCYQSNEAPKPTYYAYHIILGR